MPGCHGAGADREGFVLAQHKLPAGEHGDIGYDGHMVMLETGPQPYRISCNFNGAGRVFDFGPGTVAVRQAHDVTRTLRVSGAQRVIGLLVDPRAMELALPEPFEGRPVELVLSITTEDHVISRLLPAMVAGIESGAAGGELLFGSLARSVALYVASRYAVHRPVQSYKPQGLGRDRLSRVLEYIDAHLASDLSLDELAGVACLSSFHFGRMFKVSKGHSVHQFVLRKRMVRSMELLRTTEISLTEVAVATGFCSQSQFTTAFRRMTGTTPGAWRAQR